MSKLDHRHTERAQSAACSPEVSELRLEVLDLKQVKMVDEALSKVGPFGEVRLIKNKGKLRFIQTLESQSAL